MGDRSIECLSVFCPLGRLFWEVFSTLLKRSQWNHIPIAQSNPDPQQRALILAFPLSLSLPSPSLPLPAPRSFYQALLWGKSTPIHSGKEGLTQAGSVDEKGIEALRGNWAVDLTFWM